MGEVGPPPAGETVGAGIEWRMTIASLETRISLTRSRTIRWRSETSNVFAVARSRTRKLVIVSAIGAQATIVMDHARTRSRRRAIESVTAFAARYHALDDARCDG